MIFSVVYKKYSELGKNFVLVEEHIEALAFEVPDGNLIFVNNDGIGFMAIPAGSWAGVEPAPEHTPSTLIVQ